MDYWKNCSEIFQNKKFHLKFFIMLKRTISIAFTAALFGALLLTSCSKQDDPAAPTPSNSDPREKFNGLWHVAENSKDFGTSTYNCTITDSSNSTHILFAYLYGFNKKAYGTVNGNNFTIPAQTIQGNSISTTSAVLTNANQINLKYLVQTTSTHYDTVTAVLTK